MRRTIEAPRKEKIRTTSDGRLLGTPAEEYVPEALRRLIPPPSKATLHHVKYEKQRKANHVVGHIARTLMPLGLSEDGAVQIGTKAYRIRGVSQTRFNMLVAALKCGMTKTKACQLSGICISTLKDWEKKANEGVYPYSALMLFLDEAKAELEQTLLNAILQAGTIKESYEETVHEQSIDENGKSSEKLRTSTKVMHPKYAAAAWLLERINPAYRIDQVDQGQTSTNSEQEDLLMMDGTSVGEASEVIG